MLLDPGLLAPQLLLGAIVFHGALDRFGFTRNFWAGSEKRRLRAGVLLGMTWATLWVSHFTFDFRANAEVWGPHPSLRIPQLAGYFALCTAVLTIWWIGVKGTVRAPMGTIEGFQLPQGVALGTAATFSAASFLIASGHALTGVVSAQRVDVVLETVLLGLCVAFVVYVGLQTRLPPSISRSRLGETASRDLRRVFNRLPAAAHLCVIIIVYALILALLRGIGPFRSIWLELTPPAMTLTAGIATLVLGFLVVFAGTVRYKYRVAQLDELYAKPLRLKEDSDPSAPAISLETRMAGGRIAIVVAVSGGGQRAAFWALSVLHELEAELSDPDAKGPSPFFQATKLITGASGGMLGAAYWVGSETERAPRTRRRCAHLDSRRAMRTEAQSLLLHRYAWSDAFSFLWPSWVRFDRGTGLEQAWRMSLGPGIEKAVGALEPAEREGLVPSLVFSPTLVNDGRRLIISNVDMRPAIEHLVPPSDGPIQDDSSRVRSRSGIQLRDYLSLHKIDLATAARLSASFPFVTPAAALPFAPPIRVLDAGYYDNYGIALAIEALRLRGACEPRDDTPQKRFLIEIDALDRSGLADISDKARRPERNPASSGISRWVFNTIHRVAEGLRRPATTLSRAFQGWIAPVATLYNTREAINSFGNDAAIAALVQQDPEIEVIRISNTSEVDTLSWKLTRAELRTLEVEAKRAVVAALETKGGHELRKRLDGEDN